MQRSIDATSTKLTSTKTLNSTEDLAEETQQNVSCDTPSTFTEDQTQQPPIPGMSTDENTPLALRRPIRRASQFDEALLREDSCGDPGLHDGAHSGAARYSFRALAINQI
ncbi:unnamed protein product [Echinostoma caproni]|uniref:Uncharacterized protein n=1 Tax=Echinostoma caproni TaxID=27848 RepID=A0A183AKR9_9TREM|nr:unnamed protein product [Echinostoma caproni]